MFINNVYAGSSRVAPFVFSFVPNDTANIKGNNKIKVVVYDSVMNKSESTFILNLSL